MDTDKNQFESPYETPKQQTPGEAGIAGGAAKKILEQGAAAYEQAEQAVSGAYDKTAQKVSETYEKAKTFTNDNQGKTILIALGVGIGLGLLLGASSRRSRTSRIAQPVVNALSNIALELFS